MTLELSRDGPRQREQALGEPSSYTQGPGVDIEGKVTLDGIYLVRNVTKTV